MHSFRKHKYLVLTALFCGLILLPLIFFPISNDLSIFMLAGKMISGGGKLYRDFVELKTPAIYYLYDFFIKIAGYSEWAPRLIDFVIQIITCIWIFHLANKYSVKSLLAFISSVVYAITYVVLQYTQTGHPESFSGLFLLGMLSLTLSETNKSASLLLRGAFGGFLAGLKITMAIAIIPIILHDWLTGKYSFKENIKRLFLSSVGFIAAFAITMLPFLDSTIRNSFVDIMKYMNIYSATPRLDFAFVRFSLKEIGDFFGDNYSILLMVFIASAIYYTLTNNLKNEKESSLINLCWFLAIFLLFSVVAERKFSNYHFSRMYLPLSVLAGTGGFYLFEHLRTIFKANSAYNKLIASLLLILGLMLSPIPRWLNLIPPSMYYIINRDKYDRYYERNDGGNLRVQQKAIVSFISPALSKGDKVVVMSIGSSQINFYLQQAAVPVFPLSCFYLGNFHLPVWDNGIISEMSQAKWIVIQDNDNTLYMNGHNNTSWYSVRSSKRIYEYLSNNFTENGSTANLHLFRRIR